MPELPEVEVCRRGLQAVLAGQRILGVVVRAPRRLPLAATLGETLAGQRVMACAGAASICCSAAAAGAKAG